MSSFVAACAPQVTDAECVHLLDRYTDKLIDQTRPRATAHERALLIEDARQKARIDPEFRACPDRVSRAQLDCALAAAGADEMERCLL